MDLGRFWGFRQKSGFLGVFHQNWSFWGLSGVPPKRRFLSVFRGGDPSGVGGPRETRRGVFGGYRVRGGRGGGEGGNRREVPSPGGGDPRDEGDDLAGDPSGGTFMVTGDRNIHDYIIML